MTNSVYILEYGVRDDVISDHFAVYAVRKKKREHKSMSWIDVRDYRNFNCEIFVTLLKNHNWEVFNGSIDPNVQMSVIYWPLCVLIKRFLLALTDLYG